MNSNSNKKSDAFDGLLDFNGNSDKTLFDLDGQRRQQQQGNQLLKDQPQQQPQHNQQTHDINWNGLDFLGGTSTSTGTSSNTTTTTTNNNLSNNLLGDDTLVDGFNDFSVLDSSKSLSINSPSNNPDDFDILGDLAKPVHSHPPETHSLPKKSSSPPPHLIGQLVEMGFSALDANHALKSANFDVSAAATILISHSNANQQIDTPQEPPDTHKPKSQPPKQTQHSPQLPQSDQLLQQASTIGNDLFSKASSYWSVGKNMAQKALEDQRLRVNQQQSDQDRLRKANEKRDYEERKRRWEEGESSSFKDDDIPVQQSSFLPTKMQQSQQPEQREQSSQQPSRQSSQQSSGSLLDAFKPKSYVSPARHAVRSRTGTPVAAEPRTPTKPPITSPKPKKSRVNPPVSQAALDQSAALRIQGNEAFKLGSYAQAVELYEQAASVIPPNHIRCAVINTNLAATHVKNGDGDGGVKAASSAISIVNQDYEPSDGVNVLETVAKAYRSRASSYEMNEKHTDAQDDYEKLISISTKLASIQNQAIEGLRRVKEAQQPKKRMNTPTNTNTKNNTIKAAGEKAAKAALERSKAASLQEAAEDSERHALKDGVDAQLLQWKAGKVDNIRALLSSVDTILWPELGLKKFGMHELVSDASVKKVYMRTVSKVHPDKINTKTSSLEQRMIAQGVFATLNEAYNKHR
ncbi:hypothetical protein E3P78_02346 [Wallemia ichthyophaga]|nr:hypothetical protein E3P78_02346 [Wallemia ichthyophaga]